MYISEKFVYTELHKTAGTHIGKWLKIFASGEQVGKHTRIPKEHRNKLIIGSIRNPWDWYVSLWAYGCEHSGSVWHQTTHRINARYYWEQLPSEMGRNYISPTIFVRQIASDFIKPIRAWQESYRDSSDREAFKAWLKLIFSQERKFDVREGYGFSPISKNAGILTYRFFKFFSDIDEGLYSHNFFAHINDLGQLWQQSKICDCFIRMENLEEDLIKAMSMAGIDVSAKNREKLINARTAKTNTSSRLPTNYYYDEESIELVSNREKFLIDLFKYSRPTN